jgi:hypothetical protein
MAEYLLYCFDRYKLERCERFEAPDDNAAVAEALLRQEGRAAELWSNGRKVKDFAIEAV